MGDDIINPYWDAVSGYVDPTGSIPGGTPTVGGFGLTQHGGQGTVTDWLSVRQTYVARYSWTITAPDTLRFVAAHSQGHLLDPMAGTGYWAWLLAQAGVNVVAYDRHPPTLGSDSNRWHRNVAAHFPVTEADAEDAVSWHPSHTLLVSWPPLGYNANAILDAYQGNRVIYIGEKYGSCGDDDLFTTLEQQGWKLVASCVPVRWHGLRDVVQVYDRS
ncbi:methyltransferase domain-containing protein [Salinispora vitiensis]|uniref:hypothetical protein n=1 Tax=Salinispora vitiensis TaxID=999544 RepID=UPI00036649B4|nr:hypothetical protein [Salinispora vitiensis]